MKKQIFSLIFLEILMLTGLAWSQTATTIWFKSPWEIRLYPIL